MNIAIITGASSGLGHEYVTTIINRYKELDEIWLIARREDRLKQIARENPDIRIRTLALDLSRNSSFDILGSVLKQERPDIKILINNAGYEKTGAFETMQKSDILAMTDLNVNGFTMLNRLCLPYMKAGSSGIMTCSVTSFCPVPDLAVYSASKAYVFFLSRAIREECRKSGIHILTLCPGNMNTEMNPEGGNSQNGMINQLPFLDIKKITEKSLKLAEKGKAVYTPGTFYKFYRFLSKMIPSEWIIRFIHNI